MTDPMIARDTVAGALARWEAERRRERTEAAVAARALRAALLPLARAAGATVIRAAYEGGGDSGAIDAPLAEPEAAHAALTAIRVTRIEQVWDRAMSATVERPADCGFLDQAHALFHHVLEAQVGNWYDGDIETSGEIVWHVGDDPDRITGEHAHVRRESEWTEWSSEDDDAQAPDAAPDADREA